MFFKLKFFIILDIDECLTDKPCGDAQTDCKNTIGSYNCSCDIGYEPSADGTFCTGKLLTSVFQTNFQRNILKIMMNVKMKLWIIVINMLIVSI